MKPILQLLFHLQSSRQGHLSATEAEDKIWKRQNWGDHTWQDQDQALPFFWGREGRNYKNILKEVSSKLIKVSIIIDELHVFHYQSDNVRPLKGLLGPRLPTLQTMCPSQRILMLLSTDSQCRWWTKMLNQETLKDGTSQHPSGKLCQEKTILYSLWEGSL